MPSRRLGLTIGLAVVATLAACGGESAPLQAAGDLQRDLELAKSEQGIELVPAGSSTAVVSAIEQIGVAEPAPAPTRTRAPRPTPSRAVPKARVVRAPAPAPATPRAEQPAPRPRPTFDANVISPPPPGGYKTVDEVIRNAPFPIKP
jgi:hypothetical protein